MTEPFDREWQRLRVAATTRHRLASWADDEPVLAPFRELDDLLAATGRALPEAEADQVLAALVRRAAHDELAARVALQRLLPGLLRIALRRGATGRWQAPALFGELAAAGWIVIRTFPIERRTRRIAANLLLDAEYQVCVRPFRRRAATELPIGAFLDGELDVDLTADGRGQPSTATPHPSDELAEVLAQGEEAGLEADVDLLRRLFVESEPVGEAAARLSVSPRTVLSRRLAATERLRRVAA